MPPHQKNAGTSRQAPCARGLPGGLGEVQHVQGEHGSARCHLHPTRAHPSSHRPHHRRAAVPAAAKHRGGVEDEQIQESPAKGEAGSAQHPVSSSFLFLSLCSCSPRFIIIKAQKVRNYFLHHHHYVISNMNHVMLTHNVMPVTLIILVSRTPDCL